MRKSLVLAICYYFCTEAVAQPVATGWERQTVQLNPMNGAQPLGISASIHNGLPTLVYRQRPSGRPKLVMAQQSGGSWQTQDLILPQLSEDILFSDSVSIGDSLYAAAAYASGGGGQPDSLRIVRNRNGVTETIFDRRAVGVGYGWFLKLGSFNGTLAAAYGGVDQSYYPRSSRFLFQDSSGQFVEENMPFVSQGHGTQLSFVDNGGTPVVIHSANAGIREYARSSGGVWSSTTISSARFGFAEVTLHDGVPTVIASDHPDSGTPTPFIMRKVGGSWIQSNLPPQGIGSRDWLHVDDRLYLAYTAGVPDQGGSLFFGEWTGGHWTPQILGPASAGPDFSQFSAVAIDGLAGIAILDRQLASGVTDAVFYRQLPEPGAFSAVLFLAVCASTRPIHRRQQT